MEYLKNKPFSGKPATDDYRDNFDAVFGKKEARCPCESSIDSWHPCQLLKGHDGPCNSTAPIDAETQPELPPSDSTRQLPLPIVFYGPQPDGSYTMEPNTTFHASEGTIFRDQGAGLEAMGPWEVLVYADNARWRAWALDSLLTRNRFGNGR